MLQSMAHVNKVRYDFSQVEFTDNKRNDTSDSESSEKSEMFSAFFSGRRNLTNLVIFIYLYSAAQFSFNLITFYLKYLPGDIYENMVASSLAESLACLASGFVVRNFGPTNSFFTSFGLCTMASICLGIAI